MSSESAATAALLRRARLRLTLLTTLAAALGLVAMAALTTVIDARLRSDRLDETQLSRASRATALIFYARGELRTGGLRDDPVVGGGPLLVFEQGPDGLVPASVPAAGSGALPSGAEPLADTALRDESERGTFGSLDTGGEDLRAAALPFYRGDKVAGAVVAATSPSASESDHRRLVLIVWVACAVLLAGAGVASWALARRSVRPLQEALEHERRFLSSAAHELRTPVARLAAVAENARRLIRRPDRGGEELRPEVERLAELAEESGRTVDALLTVARMDADRAPMALVPMRLDGLLSEVELRHPDVTADVEEPIGIVGDAEWLGRMFDELVLNARVHGRGAEPAHIELRLTREGEDALVVVSDGGDGFPESLRSTAFERFVSGPASRGSGLGLWIARWVVEGHAGTIGIGAGGERAGMVEVRLPARD